MAQAAEDFKRVWSADSFFLNALVSGVIESQGEQVIDKFVFKECSPVVRVLVESAIDLGLQKRAERVA